MSTLDPVLVRLAAGEAISAEELLPVVYDELRRIAEHKLHQERSGQTLQATALVHEAYARLVSADPEKRWDSRGHFFSAAAEAMRRILIDQARRKQAVKHGGGLERHRLSSCEIASEVPSDELLSVHESLERFAAVDPVKAELVKLRYFAGLTIHQAGEALGIASATADRYWAYARAWLHADLKQLDDSRS
jgi:RNA polymerase sigma factor (TIGR02999 family)